MNESRIMRIARGSGRQVRDVKVMLEEYKRNAKVVHSTMKGLKSSAPRSRNMNAQNMLNKICGMDGFQSLMKQMEIGTVVKS